MVKILWPLVGGSPNHIRNTQHFVEQAKSIHLQQQECMSSYDVKAIFTSVPVDPALDIIWGKLQQDKTLHNRTPLSTHNNMSLLQFCLKSTFFTFQGKYYEQVQGAAMGSPLSPMVANLFMEDFKARVLSSSPKWPRIWLRFMDDTLIVHKAEHTQWFLSILIPLICTYNSQLSPKINMVSSLLGHLSLTSPLWNTNHHSLQKAHT